MVWISLGLSVAAMIASGWVAWTTRKMTSRLEELARSAADVSLLSNLNSRHAQLEARVKTLESHPAPDVAAIIKAATDPVVEVYRPRQVDAPVNEPAGTSPPDPDSDPAYWDTYDPTDETIPATMPTQHGLPMLPGVDLPEFPLMDRGE